jgi:23S rRNA G2069 N7-methylase RlmK/C1962 C5-methylase RlmI
VRAWVARAIKARRTYDLVLCVAPSWLSARDAGGAEWELSRDAQGLVERASRLLSPRGTLLFACDDPMLRLDGEALVRLGFAVQDESAAVVPHDFERARPLVSCWTVRRA